MTFWQLTFRDGPPLCREDTRSFGSWAFITWLLFSLWCQSLIRIPELSLTICTEQLFTEIIGVHPSSIAHEFRRTPQVILIVVIPLTVGATALCSAELQSANYITIHILCRHLLLLCHLRRVSLFAANVRQGQERRQRRKKKTIFLIVNQDVHTKWK